ncbi:MAG: PHP domain-containing protein [Candidatus Cloacimonetes bacterium]|nr:PHP domain-containing protein [Candidatus Cloacimonadota bacterium]
MYQRNIFKRNYRELTGCLHVHTEYSFDSRTPVQQVVKAAHRHKLDYLGINDHLCNSAKDDINLKNEKQLIIIPGLEINDPGNNNHLLVYGCGEVLENKPASEYVPYYRERGATTFAAHPFERRSSRQIRRYIWTDTEIDQFSGLEIWNALSNWVSKIRPSINGLLWVLLAHNFIRRGSRAAIRWWDKMNNAGVRKAAIGSVDAHGLIFKKMGLSFTLLKHKFMFNTVRTNVLLPEDWPIDQEHILKALAAGRSYIINYHRGIPYNFYAGVAVKNEPGVSFGEEIAYTEGMHYYYRLPKIARVRLYRNGEFFAQQLDEKGKFALSGSGNYRLEILLHRLGWIYTNNIYVK